MADSAGGDGSEADMRGSRGVRSGRGDSGRRIRSDSWANWAVAASVLFILVMTMVPTGQDVEPVIRLCMICGAGGVASFFLNVLLFVPFGLAMQLRFGSIRVAVAAGFLLTLGVEVTQLVIPGRFTTLADLVANTTGALAGALLARPHGWILPEQRLGRSLAAGWAVVAVVVVSSSAVLISPSAPAGDWYAQWTPQLQSLDGYEGRVLSAEIGNLPLPLGLVEPKEEVRALFGTGAPIELRFQAGPPTRRLAPVLRMVAGPFGQGTETFQVGVDREDLVIRPRYRADDLYLTRPDLRLRGRMAAATVGDTLTVAVWQDPDGGHRVAVDRGTPVLLGVTAGRGWSLLRYIGRLPDRLLSLADHLWIAALLLPLGWWAPSRRHLFLGAAPLLALALVPLWSTLLPTPFTHLLAGAGALLAGHVLRAGANRLIPSTSSTPRGTGRSRQASVSLN